APATGVSSRSSSAPAAASDAVMDDAAAAAAPSALGYHAPSSALDMVRQLRRRATHSSTHSHHQEPPGRLSPCRSSAAPASAGEVFVRHGGVEYKKVDGLPATFVSRCGKVLSLRAAGYKPVAVTRHRTTGHAVAKVRFPGSASGDERRVQVRRLVAATWMPVEVVKKLGLTCAEPYVGPLQEAVCRLAHRDRDVLNVGVDNLEVVPN
ncbi:hypothetical protein Agub_g15962, partial [Astrephomene gubernaculifera]